MFGAESGKDPILTPTPCPQFTFKELTKTFDGLYSFIVSPLELILKLVWFLTPVGGIKFVCNELIPVFARLNSNNWKFVGQVAITSNASESMFPAERPADINSLAV